MQKQCSTPSPAVTSVEVYGFVGWITSAVAFVTYLLWAYVPDRVLWYQGVTYYPSKYWALAIPTWVCVTVVAAYWWYESLNMMLASPEHSLQGSDSIAHLPFSQGCRVGFCNYFSASGSTSILPLRVLPQELVDLVLNEGLPPLEAEQIYRRRMRSACDQSSGSEQEPCTTSVAR